MVINLCPQYTPAPTRKCLTYVLVYLSAVKLLLRVVYIQILYNIVHKLHTKYNFLRCLTMGFRACYLYVRSIHNRGLDLMMVISVSHLRSRVGAGILDPELTPWLTLMCELVSLYFLIRHTFVTATFMCVMPYCREQNSTYKRAISADI